MCAACRLQTVPTRLLRRWRRRRFRCPSEARQNDGQQAGRDKKLLAHRFKKHASRGHCVLGVSPLGRVLDIPERCEHEEQTHLGNIWIGFSSRLAGRVSVHLAEGAGRRPGLFLLLGLPHDVPPRNKCEGVWFSCLVVFVWLLMFGLSLLLGLPHSVPLRNGFCCCVYSLGHVFFAAPRPSSWCTSAKQTCTPNLPARIIPTKIAWFRISGKFPMDVRIPPLGIKILLESNPLKSRILVRRLAIEPTGP